jgi:hypothetical protein
MLLYSTHSFLASNYSNYSGKYLVLNNSAFVSWRTAIPAAFMIFTVTGVLLKNRMKFSTFSSEI